MSIVTYPPTSVSITGAATETTLLAIKSSVDGISTKVDSTNLTLSTMSTALANILSKLSLEVIIAPFYQAVNSIINSQTQIGVVPVGKELQKIALKCNDGCTFVIDVNGTDKIITLPSGEVQFYDLNAVAGDVISIRQAVPFSNVGPLTINFFG